MFVFFRGLKSNRVFNCINCFNLFRRENKLKKHKNISENHDYCYVEIPEEDNKILKYSHGKKRMKVWFIIYTDLNLYLKKWTLIIRTLKCHQQLK